MAQRNRDNLGYLGEDFQYKLVHEFMDNHTFFEDLNPIIDQNMFTDPNLKTIVGVLKNYYEKYNIVSDYDNVGIELRDLSRSEKEKETYLAVLEKVKNTNPSGVESTREKAEVFFRQQNIVRTANEILKIAEKGEDGEYDRCVNLLNDAMTKGIHNDFGEGLFDHINETLSDDYRIPIPTGIGKIDETLEGGLGRGELGVIIGPTSFGKSQPLDSQIITPSGFKRMGDIKVGDYVIGADGKKHIVSGVFPQGMRPIYKVSFSNGTSCECDIEHLWNVNSLYQRCGKKYIAGVSKNRDDKKYVPDHTFKTLTLREILSKGLVKRGRYNFKVPVAKPVEFDSIETQFDPYLVGYYIGDGCFSRANISVGTQDKNEIESALSTVLGEDLHIFYREGRDIYSFDIVGRSKSLLREVFNPYIHSDGKFIPKEYLFNSIEKRAALLQGLMDSDGHANNNGSCEFCSKSKQLALDVQFLVRSLGGFASLVEDDSSYFLEKNDERVNCGKRYRVTISMCDSSIRLFRLERKQKRVKYRTRHADSLFITGAEYVGEKEAQCIMVNSDEHLYLTEDFIVTHNTSLTTAMASHAACSGHKVLQIVFEDRIKQIQRKHLGRITGIEARDLSKPENIELVKKTIEAFPDKEKLAENLRIVKFPSGEKTARDIKRFIQKLINTGFRPELVIVDYFECLAHEVDKTTSNEYEREGKTMRVFEAMAGELDMAFWIPSQGTKDSINLELVTMDKIGGSVKKAQIAHVIMSIARTVEDIDNNKATIAILKNRAGKSGKVLQGVEFNNGTCRISTDNVEELDTLYQAKEKRNEEQLKIQNAIAQQMREQTKNR